MPSPFCFGAQDCPTPRPSQDRGAGAQPGAPAASGSQHPEAAAALPASSSPPTEQRTAVAPEDAADASTDLADTSPAGSQAGDPGGEEALAGDPTSDPARDLATSHWETMVREGGIDEALAGPPCETWARPRAEPAPRAAEAKCEQDPNHAVVVEDSEDEASRRHPPTSEFGGTQPMPSPAAAAAGSTQRFVLTPEAELAQDRMEKSVEHIYRDMNTLDHRFGPAPEWPEQRDDAEGFTKGQRVDSGETGIARFRGRAARKRESQAKDVASASESPAAASAPAAAAEHEAAAGHREEEDEVPDPAGGQGA